MQKKHIILFSAMTISVAGTGILIGAQTYASQIVRGGAVSHIVLNSSDGVVEKDEGYLHQIDVKGNKIDMIGYSDKGGDFGSIKKATYGTYKFNGIVYNRSVINGFSSLTVTFDGGDLYYVFTDFLMEDMNFDGANALVSGEAVNVPDGEAYFLIYNTSETPVNIDSIDIAYSCDGSIDTQMLFNQNSSLSGGARSYAKRADRELGYVELENNPTKSTNNYSPGKTGGHANKDSWYRFNGRYFGESKDLGTDFTLGMTVIGNISQVIDPNKYFHYNVWPQFTYGDDNDAQWMQSYIGNDNYEPLGKDHALRPDDPYVLQSYPGRFFTDYRNVGDDKNPIWQFVDPDVAIVYNGTKTLREAYETYPLPYWFVKFHVYLDEDNDPKCDVFINGFHVASDWVFEHYDTVNTPSIRIRTLPMHVVNYGVDVEGNPADSYVGSFTYPRLVD